MTIGALSMGDAGRDLGWDVGWDDDPAVQAWPGAPALAGDAHADACVVGLGASGLAAVEEFAARGLSVLGIDARRIAAGAAGRNGGFLLGGPALFLHDAIERWGGEAAVGIYRATLDELARLRATLGPDVVRATGSIRLAGLPGDAVTIDEQCDRSSELADIARQAEALRNHGIAVEDYAGPLGVGIFLPDDAAVNPAVRAVATAAALRAEPRVGLHEHTRAMRIEPGLVTTDRGRISAGAIVVAVDGGLDELVPDLFGDVRTARLQMLATEPVPNRLPCPVYGRWGYDYAQQLPDGRLFVGGGRDMFEGDEWTDEATPTDQVQAYIARVAERMAGRPVAVTHRWAASVGFTPSGRPLCTRLGDGVAAAGGYNGTGNLVGPVAARAAVALLLDGTAPPSYFAYGRMAG